MIVKYLGTAAAEGWPALFCHCENCERARAAGGKNLRSRPQMLVDETLLMDFGPDTFYHAMHFGFDMGKVEQVLLTHSHTDHFYATELILRALPYAFDRDKNPLTIYGNEKCRQMFERMLAVEDDSYNLGDCVRFQEIHALEAFSIPGYRVRPLKASHDKAENCLIFDILSEDGRRLLYGNDTGMLEEETWEALAGSRFDLISLDCTMGKTPGCYAHMGLKENLETRKRLMDMGCGDAETAFVLTHFSHNGGLLHEELEERTRDLSIMIAFDGLELRV